MFETKFKPMGGRVLIKQGEVESKTASGLIIPDAVQEKLLTGTVVATGPGRHNKDGSLIPMDFKCGDVVYFDKYSATDIGHGNLVLVDDDEIFGILE